MTYIKLKVTRKLTCSQKRKIINGFSDTLAAVTGRPDKAIRVVIEEKSDKGKVTRQSVAAWGHVAWPEESLYYFSRDYN